MQFVIRLYSGGVYGGGSSASLLLPGSVLLDARRGHPALYLRLRRFSRSSHTRHGSHDLRCLV